MIELFRCACPRCPGYPYRASETPHPLSTCAERWGDHVPKPYPDDEVTEEIPDIEAHNAALLADHERANR